jgi:hypothetical protein
MSAYMYIGLYLQLWGYQAFSMDCDKARIISKFVLSLVSDFISLYIPMWYYNYRRTCKPTE